MEGTRFHFVPTLDEQGVRVSTHETPDVSKHMHPSSTALSSYLELSIPETELIPPDKMPVSLSP